MARRAARELELGAGIDSTSVHALLARLDRGQRLPDGCVLVLDEAGMLGTRQLARVLDHMTVADGKLVLVGDHRQLPELEAGGTFRALARRPAAIRLEENRRQVAGWERDALDHLRAGRAEAALDVYAGRGRLRCAATSTEAHKALVDDWWSASNHDRSLIIARTRRDIAELNHMARRRMAANDVLGTDELRLFGQRFARATAWSSDATTSAPACTTATAAGVLAVDARRMQMVVALDGRLDPTSLDARFLLRRTGAWRSADRPRLRRHGPRRPGHDRGPDLRSGRSWHLARVGVHGAQPRAQGEPHLCRRRRRERPSRVRPRRTTNTASAPAISSLATSLEAMRSRSLSISSQEHGSRGIEL